MVEGMILDGARLADRHLTEEEHIEAAFVEADISGHPAYPHESMRRMAKGRLKSTAYPRKGLLQFDRVWNDGDILHSYAAYKVGEEWIISFYLPFTQGWGEMSEIQFIALPIAKSLGIKSRAGQLANPRRT